MLKGDILARKEGSTFNNLNLKRFPKGCAWNLIADGYTIYNLRGEKLIGWNDVEDILNGKKAVELKMEVI